MGLFGFGKKSEPITINIPEIKPPSMQEILSASTAQAQGIAPLAMGAREGALGDLGLGSQYYQQFQPTSLEQALGNQYFQNIIPDLEKRTKGYLSQSGMASSPILARLMGRNIGQVGYDVGKYLSDLGNQRAQYSLSSRLGIDPFSMINPLVETGMNQWFQQAQLQRQADLARAQVDMANQIKAQQPTGLGRLIGAGAGLALAPFTGGMAGIIPGLSVGSSLGGLLEGDFGAGDALGLMGGAGYYGDFFKNAGNANLAKTSMLKSMGYDPYKGLSFAQDVGQNLEDLTGLQSLMKVNPFSLPYDEFSLFNNNPLGSYAKY